MPTPQQIVQSVPFSQRSAGSPAGDALRQLIQEDAVKKQQMSLNFQGKVAQENAAATQPFQDEQTPESLMQQAGQAGQMPQPGMPGPGQQPTGAPPMGPPAAGMQTNPQAGPANPQQGPQPAPTPTSDHTGSPKFARGRKYVG